MPFAENFFSNFQGESLTKSGNNRKYYRCSYKKGKAPNHQSFALNQLTKSHSARLCNVFYLLIFKMLKRITFHLIIFQNAFKWILMLGLTPILFYFPQGIVLQIVAYLSPQFYSRVMHNLLPTSHLL